MSYETVITKLRDDLVRGAERRRRHERRARTALTILPILVVVTLAGVWWQHAARTQDDAPSSPTPTVVASKPTPAVVAACDSLIDLQLDVSLFGDWESATRRFADLATRSGDGELTALGRSIAVDPPETASVVDAIHEGVPRCRAVGAPDYVPTYVPAALGPEPLVDLAAYGRIVAWSTPDSGTQLPAHLTDTIVGHDLRPVELAQADGGNYAVRWNRAGPTGRLSCTFLGGGAGSGSIPWTFSASSGCGDGPSTIIEVARSSPALSARAQVQDDVAFVVTETATERLVQRPAAGMVAMSFGPETPTRWTMAAYDAKGVQLDCMDESNSPC